MHVHIALCIEDGKLLKQVQEYLSSRVDDLVFDSFDNASEINCQSYDLVLLEDRNMLELLTQQWPYSAHIFVVAERVSVSIANQLLQFNAAGVISRKKMNFDILIDSINRIRAEKDRLVSLKTKMESCRTQNGASKSSPHLPVLGSTT